MRGDAPSRSGWKKKRSECRRVQSVRACSCAMVLFLNDLLRETSKMQEPLSEMRSFLRNLSKAVVESKACFAKAGKRGCKCKNLSKFSSEQTFAPFFLQKSDSVYKIQLYSTIFWSFRHHKNVV